MTPTRSLADAQAAKIVEEFEKWAIEIRGCNYPPKLIDEWIGGANLFARRVVINLLGAVESKPYRNQIDAIRDRVLPPVEVENLK